MFLLGVLVLVLRVFTFVLGVYMFVLGVFMFVLGVVLRVFNFVLVISNCDNFLILNRNWVNFFSNRTIFSPLSTRLIGFDIRNSSNEQQQPPFLFVNFDNDSCLKWKFRLFQVIEGEKYTIWKKNRSNRSWIDRDIRVLISAKIQIREHATITRDFSVFLTIFWWAFWLGQAGLRGRRSI